MCIQYWLIGSINRPNYLVGTRAIHTLIQSGLVRRGARQPAKQRKKRIKKVLLKSAIRSFDGSTLKHNLIHAKQNEIDKISSNKLVFSKMTLKLLGWCEFWSKKSSIKNCFAAIMQCWCEISMHIANGLIRFDFLNIFECESNECLFCVHLADDPFSISDYYFFCKFDLKWFYFWIFVISCLLFPHWWKEEKMANFFYDNYEMKAFLKDSKRFNLFFRNLCVCECLPTPLKCISKTIKWFKCGKREKKYRIKLWNIISMLKSLLSADTWWYSTLYDWKQRHWIWFFPHCTLHRRTRTHTLK